MTRFPLFRKLPYCVFRDNSGLVIVIVFVFLLSYLIRWVALCRDRN